ncbi:pentatricopeptide repeat-containing protein-like [Dorcoceras hygrometricum]|uniref:Pentatricopeptide repeat-containing protein-like n=1 Tax=Dorcoceras hygrometricum TaxID=472368 RepID=A0A2Z7DCY3_9LAMI|nr:pentatricopeptide repeat-containing protein-like [Dorcoceras hygrometricum]
MCDDSIWCIQEDPSLRPNMKRVVHMLEEVTLKYYICVRNMKKLLLSQYNLFCHHFGLMLEQCMKSRTLKPCQQIHALMLTKPVDMNSFSLCSKLIGAYASCGDLDSSRSLFQESPNPNTFAFNWMILTLTFSGFHGEAIGYFSSLTKSRNPDIFHNEHTLSAVLKCCVGLLDLNLGRQVQGIICKTGFEMYALVCNALMDMYRKCGKMNSARNVFDRMSERDVVSWTNIICGYSDHGKMVEAVDLFQRMRLEGIKANEFTWNSIIAGHARIGDCDGAFRFFTRMREERFVPDLPTWNGMISGFVQSRKASEAMEAFHSMLVAEVKPDPVTVTGLLPACGMIGSVPVGREIHGMIYRMEIFVNVFVTSALIDMYSKCGSIKDAWNIFNTTYTKNAASWNAMIGCYGMHGMVDSAIKLFEKMQEEEIQANEVTLNAVLCACSHGGQVEKGVEFFTSMVSYNVTANHEHFACVVDLLCRFGRMEEAFYIVKQMPVLEGTNSVIGAFLNGCKIHGRSDLAEIISKHLGLEMRKPADFVTLSNIYASEGKWEGVQDVREVMKDNRVHKKPGFSSV